MKLILKEDVPNLGKAGDLVEVARGYGRNFLVPQGKALDATAHHLRELEEQKRLIIKKKTKDLEAAQKLAEQITSLELTLSRKVSDGEKILGSVTSKDVAEALAKAQITLDRKNILLEDPIRTLGNFEIPLKIHPGMTVQLRLKVSEEK
jgi:large subunit ribosomal protein L9